MLAPATTSSNLQPWQWPIRVYYEDTDAGGIVFYANYLKFFERSRTEWLRSFGFDHQSTQQKHGVMYVVKDLKISYEHPAKLDDMLLISVKLIKLGAASLSLEQSASKLSTDSGKLQVLAEASLRLACVGLNSLKPVAVPKAVLRALKPLVESCLEPPDCLSGASA